jgi:signal transduction histidine kinase
VLAGARDVQDGQGRGGAELTAGFGTLRGPREWALCHGAIPQWYPVPSMASPLRTSRVLLAGALAAAGLLVVGWFDYSATRRDLLQLLREQAVTLRRTITAAARANQSAGAQAEAQMHERLLDNVRLLAEIDRARGLDASFLDRIATSNRLFRVAVFGTGGTREYSSGGEGAGFGASGRGFPAAGLLERILAGSETEAVGDMHSPRWGGRARVAAGIRRANGGAILINADAGEIEALQRQTSLERLVGDMVAATGQLAYVTIDRGDLHIAQGNLPTPDPTAPAVVVQDASAGVLLEREMSVGGRPVLEFAGPVALGDGQDAGLRVGLRLDDLRRSERRMMIRLAVSLAAALVLSLLALGTMWLRQAYSALSEKHALAEAALRRRDRLSAMGELASTVAHEVRNPLNAIAMSAQRLRREYPAVASTATPEDRGELDQLLGVVEGETRRINDVVQQFLEYARPPKLAPREASLGDETRQLAEAARALAESRGVALTLDVDRAGTAVFDPAQLREAVDNLLRNAIEATPAGGQVSVTAVSTAKGHTIEIRDTGHGIPAEDLPKVFDLYFTTKPHGTGIGLAVAQQVASAHGGTIEVDSAPGRGTRMTLHLPKAGA